MSEEEGRKGGRAKCLKPINKNKVDNNDGGDNGGGVLFLHGATTLTTIKSISITHVIV